MNIQSSLLKLLPRLAAALLLPFLALAANAQANQIHVESFDHLENDQTAILEPQLDNSGSRCALIVVEDIDDDVKLSFDAGASFVKVEEIKGKNGKKSYNIWVSGGSRRLRIYSPDKAIGELNYIYPVSIKKAEVYRMRLSRIFSSKTISSGSTYLSIHVSPANAIVEVDGEPWPVNSGIAEKPVRFGSHTFSVKAENHYPDAGRVEVTESGRREITITLQPKFGWLKITGGADITGAAIYIDGKLMGHGQIKTEPIPSGSHTLKVTKEHYQMFEQEITIYDNQTTSISPVLKPNSATTTLEADPDVEIYIDHAWAGLGTWRGPLDKGDHFIECRKQGHTTTQQKITINNIAREHNFKLDKPQPILGELDVVSDPRGAEVKIDGKLIGTTPLRTSVIIGTHALRIDMPNSSYQPYQSNIEILESKTTSINQQLTTTAKATVTLDPSKAVLYVDNRKIFGHSPLTISGQNGKKAILRAECDGYKPASKTITLGTDKNVHLKLKEIKMRTHRRTQFRTDTYLEVGYLMKGYKGIAASWGFHISGFNIQADYAYAFANRGYRTYGLITHKYDGGGWIETWEYNYYIRHIYGGKIGGGIIWGRLKVTPQAGYHYYGIRGYQSYCHSCDVSLRTSLNLFGGVAVTVTPEYSFKVAAGDGYKFLCQKHPAAKDWCEGFKLKIGIALYSGE